MNYYESVVAGGGDRIKENVALYLVPGMDHCTGGEGAFDVDWLAALEQWDRAGQKPSALDARHPALVSGGRGRRRRRCELGVRRPLSV